MEQRAWRSVLHQMMGNLHFYIYRGDVIEYAQTLLKIDGICK